MKILVINCGSSSLKYQLIDMDGEKLLAKGNFERIGEQEAFVTHKVNGEKYVTKSPVMDHEQALKIVLEQLVHKDYGVIKDLSEINAVGHRLVHGGEIFDKSVARYLKHDFLYENQDFKGIINYLRLKTKGKIE